MSKFKIKAVIYLFIIIVLVGVLKVNSEYTKDLDRFPGEDILVNSDGGSSPQAPEIYNEINLSARNKNRLKIYFKAKPFDLRVNSGKYIMYINRQALGNIADYASNTMGKGLRYLKQGIENVKDAGMGLTNSLLRKNYQPGKVTEPIR